ncbi:MAG TPA: type II secretion system F family protein [Gaiellaceae bacterium]|nr:type II secretion system F family protein [Gaiellaceae bacterium]
MRIGPKHALAALAVAAAAWLAPSATAGDHLRLVEAGRADFPKRAFVLTLPGKRSLTASDVRVLENGEPVSDVSLAPAGSTGGEDSGVVLVLDASKSMRGQAIRDAVSAARVFAERRPPNQHMGIVAFNNRASVLLPLTNDDDAIADALAKPPRLAAGTHLYDGVDTALAALAESDVSVGTVIVLSDGADTGSSTSAAAVAAEARKARVRVFTVGIRSPQFSPRPLKRLGAGTSAAYAEATSSGDLARVYAELGARLANEYVLTYRSAVGANRRVRVAVRVVGVPGLAVSGYTTPRTEASASGPFHQSALNRVLQSPLTMLAVALLIAGLLAFTVFSLVVPRRRTLRTRMAEFVSLRTPTVEGGEAPGRAASRVLVGAERSLEGTKWWNRFKETLELAEIRMSATRIALWTLAATLLAMWLVVLVLGSPIFAVIGLAVPFVVRSLIYRKLERRRKQFGEQLPDNLQVLASALRAGHSFVGALSVVIDDADEPSRSEFRRVVADEQLGVPLEDAIRSVVRRMDNEDLEQVALVAALQRQTGGNMAEVLERVTDTIRERFELRRMVQTLTAQGRMSRWIVSALPVVLLVAISIINPEYIQPLFRSTGGRLALMLAAAMLVAGSLVIKKIVNIKV